MRSGNFILHIFSNFCKFLNRFFFNLHTVYMKKFIFFIASVLSLSVIFGSGWAAGVGKSNSSVNVSTKISEPEGGEYHPDCDENQRTDNENREDKNQYEDNSEKSGGQIRFRFEIPSPADLRDRIIKLPYLR